MCYQLQIFVGNTRIMSTEFNKSNRQTRLDTVPTSTFCMEIVRGEMEQTMKPFVAQEILVSFQL